MTIVLTHHALDRIKARTNFSPTRAQEIAEEAYYCGKDIKDFEDEKEKQRYLINVLNASHEQGCGDIIRVMGNDIYIFGGATLITVFPFPPKIIALKNKQKYSKRKFYEEEFDYWYQTKICKI